MNNLLSYFGLIDAKIGASDKDLPLTISMNSMIRFGNYLWKLFNIKDIIAESMLMEVGFLLILFS
jgi:hypothetical protein